MAVLHIGATPFKVCRRRVGGTVVEHPRTHTLEEMGEQSSQKTWPIRVEVVYFEGCPHWREALANLEDALDQVGRSDPAEAQVHRMAGSPTVMIDGRDMLPGGESAWGCRLYLGEAGPQGAPSVKSLVELLS